MTSSRLQADGKKEGRAELFVSHLDLVWEAARRFSERHPWQEKQALQVGRDTLVRCVARFNPEQGPFINYLRAALRRELGTLKRESAVNFSDVPRPTHWNDGGEWEFDPPAEVIQRGETVDASLAGREFPAYTEEEKTVALLIYDKLLSDDPELARIFRWSAAEGLNLNEIGRRIGRSAATAWRRKQQARRRIKHLLDRMGMGGRQARPRDWGNTMIDPQLMSRYDPSREDRRLPPGWTRHLCADSPSNPRSVNKYLNEKLEPEAVEEL